MKFPLIYPPSLSVLVEKTVTHHESVGGNTPNTRLYVNVCRFTHAQNTNTRSKHGCFEIWDTEFVQINGLACSILVVGDISVCPASSIYKHLHIYITPSQKIGLSINPSLINHPYPENHNVFHSALAGLQCNTCSTCSACSAKKYRIRSRVIPAVLVNP
jgi:hypothetical protein